MKRLPEKTPGRGFAGDYPDFCDLVHARAAGRTSDAQISFYHNMGIRGFSSPRRAALGLKKRRNSASAALCRPNGSCRTFTIDALDERLPQA